MKNTHECMLASCYEVDNFVYLICRDICNFNLVYFVAHCHLVSVSKRFKVTDLCNTHFTIANFKLTQFLKWNCTGITFNGLFKNAYIKFNSRFHCTGPFQK